MTTEPQETTPAAAAAPTTPPITPEDIQHQEFGVSRFGGYKMRDVDEFLDRLTESTQALLLANERLRDGGPIMGTSDLDDVNRQADEILERAREKAARIVADAEARAGGAAEAPSTTAGAAGAMTASRAAIDPFLVQERDFLQRLATLVQGHAESVKDMARKTRQAPPPVEAASPVAAASVEADDDARAAVPEEEPQTAPAEGADEAQEDAPGNAPGNAPEDAAEDANETIDVRAEAQDEPEDAADLDPETEEREATREPGQEVAADARGGDGDPSLKSLFWGDER